MRKLLASTLLAALTLVPIARASAAVPHGGGGGGPVAGLLGMVRLAAQNGSRAYGIVQMAYNPRLGKIDVAVAVSGLQPFSVHPEHVHQGASCASNGPVIYPLATLRADARGMASAETTINARSVPASGLYVNVHQGPGLVGAQFTPIACGLVRRADAAALISPEAGSDVQGLALLAFNSATTDVTLLVTGLAPGSLHPAHIHLGPSCASNGPVTHPLPLSRASAGGVAFASTGFLGSRIAPQGWYVNVHRGPGLVGAQFTPIGCGVVQRAVT